ncbi:MAG: contractile injection system tape measure protein [Gammaproteobacteria bacterium]|nr:contractile injection system tape measure protein [Gammaproteobacteria bacterium]
MIEDQMLVTNAGIVLLAPYLPRLFAMLELTGDDGFVDDERAAHLLHYAATGGTDALEYELALNKLLCGITFGRPLARVFESSDVEREAVASLLNAVIEHWRTAGNTSVDGLRTSFLQREGRLHRVEQGWHLLVETRAFDMLLDGLPWSYNLIRYPWMDGVLHVEWR